MKLSLAALLALANVSTLLVTTDASPLGHRGNKLDSQSYIQNCTEVNLSGKKVTDPRSFESIQKRNELETAVLHLLPRGGTFFPKGPKGKDDPDDSSTGVPSFSGGSGSGKDSDNFGGGSGGAIIGPPSDVSPVTASPFSKVEEEATRKSGESIQQDLRTAILSNRPDNDKGSVESNGYARINDEEQEGSGFGPLGTDLKDNGRYLEAQFGIKASNSHRDGWDFRLIKNNAGADKHISKYAVNVAERTFIFRDSRNKDNDDNLKEGVGNKDSLMKLRDMAMDSWRVAAGSPDKVKELKWIVRDNVVTKESQDAINAAFSKAGIDRKTKGVFQPTSTDPNQLAAYQQIVGSPHGQGIIKMMSDHHTELGDLELVAFHVFTDGNTRREKDRAGGTIPGYYAIVAELGRR